MPDRPVDRVDLGPRFIRIGRRGRVGREERGGLELRELHERGSRVTRAVGGRVPERELDRRRRRFRFDAGLGQMFERLRPHAEHAIAWIDGMATVPRAPERGEDEHCERDEREQKQHRDEDAHRDEELAHRARVGAAWPTALLSIDRPPPASFLGVLEPADVGAPGVVVAVVDELDRVDCALIGGDTLGSPVPPVTLAPRPGVGSSGTHPRPAKYTSGHAWASLFFTCHTPSCGVP